MLNKAFFCLSAVMILATDSFALECFKASSKCSSTQETSEVFEPHKEAPRELEPLDSLRYMRVSADFLYFKAIQDSLTYSIKTPLDSTGGPAFSGGSLKEPSWKYSAGVRLDIDWPIRWDEWEMGASWTYLSNNASQTASGSATSSFYTVLSQSNVGLSGNNYATSASTSWKLLFNIFELNFAKSVVLSKGLKIRPILGAQAALIKQNNYVKYTYINDNPSATSPQTVNGNNKIWGLGPKIALDTTLVMPYQLDLNFLASVASLYGQGKGVARYSSFINTLTPFSESVVTQANRLFTNMQLQISFEKEWTWDDISFAIAAGWETQTWFQLARINYYGTITEPVAGSNLTIQGPFFRAFLAF